MAIFDFSQSDPPATGPQNAEKSPSAPSPGRPRFPLKTALAVLVLAASLLAWHLRVDPARGFAPGLIAETFALRWPHPPAPVVPMAPAPRPKAEGKLPAVSPVFSDDSGSLDPFFAALWKLEQGKEPSVVTILHYGDSPTTADLITGDVRAQLQSRFGDAGRGYTLIAKPWAWYGHRGVEITDHGWKIRTGVGLMREGIYGLGGAAFEGDASAWSRFRLTESQQTSVDIEYLAKPGAGAFAVDADDQQILEQKTDADRQAARSLHVALPSGTKTVTVRPTSGMVTLFGAEFHRGSRGVLYDSLGLNGATTSVVARVLQPALWKQEVLRADPQLVVINYGSNESSFGSFVHKQYAAELRLAIQRVRQADPQTAILVMSPMDRGERAGLDEIETMSTIPEIVAIQRQVAAETHCAFFDTYDAMGGDGTMARWYAASPRLVTADLLHPTPPGATIVAGLFVEQLGLGYNRWKMQHGIAPPPAAIQAQASPGKLGAAPNRPTAKPAPQPGKKAKQG